MRNSNIFGFVSKIKSMQPLTKRHKILNIKKGVLAPRKRKTYLPEGLARVFFLNNMSSSHYALPSESSADLHNGARSAELLSRNVFWCFKNNYYILFFENLNKKQWFQLQKYEKYVKSKIDIKTRLEAFNQELWTKLKFLTSEN